MVQDRWTGTNLSDDNLHLLYEDYLTYHVDTALERERERDYIRYNPLLVPKSFSKLVSTLGSGKQFVTSNVSLTTSPTKKPCTRSVLVPSSWQWLTILRATYKYTVCNCQFLYVNYVNNINLLLTLHKRQLTTPSICTRAIWLIAPFSFWLSSTLPLSLPLPLVDILTLQDHVEDDHTHLIMSVSYT